MNRRTFLLSAGALAATLPLRAEPDVLRAVVYGHTGRFPLKNRKHPLGSL
jgi:hypothetical protein